MERHEVLAMMTTLKLAGMRAAYDDILADGLKRRHPVQQIFGALLQAEIADKTARSIKYQMASARLPAAKELAEFDFAASPVNEPLIRDLAMGGFLEAKRNIVLVGGTGTGKTHLAVAIARSCIRKGARGRFYNVVDLVNLLEAEIRSGRQGRTADQLTRRVIGEWIDFYNTERPHSALGGKTPAEAYRGAPPVDMMDKPLPALPTSPQAQQQRQGDRFKGILAA